MNPIICSFFTKEYTELAARMERSARSFGFDTDIIQIEKINGKWLDTIYWRPEFIAQMLAKHKRPVVWLDCDAVIEQDPVLFRHFEGDFGIHIHDFPWRDRDHLGGTMYFAYNARVVHFLSAWITLNETMERGSLSQRIIPYAINKCPRLIVQELPATYCLIFDHMKHCGEAVIKHHQASRQFRN